MKISTKGRYALRMMLDLATHQGDGYVALKDIAQRQEISKNIWSRSCPCWANPTFCAPRAAIRAATGWPVPRRITPSVRSCA